MFHHAMGGVLPRSAEAVVLHEHSRPSRGGETAFLAIFSDRAAIGQSLAIAKRSVWTPRRSSHCMAISPCFMQLLLRRSWNAARPSSYPTLEHFSRLEHEAHSSQRPSPLMTPETTSRCFVSKIASHCEIVQLPVTLRGGTPP